MARDSRRGAGSTNQDNSLLTERTPGMIFRNYETFIRRNEEFYREFHRRLPNLYETYKFTFRGNPSTGRNPLNVILEEGYLRVCLLHLLVFNTGIVIVTHYLIADPG